MNWRTLLVHGGLIINGCTEERDHPLIDQVLAIVTLPIRDASAGERCMETMGRSDSPDGHVAAVTPAGHAETRWIDRIFFYHCINSGEDVAQIAAAKIFHVTAGKILSLTITSARIRHQQIVAARRQCGDDGPRHSKAGRPSRCYCA